MKPNPSATSVNFEADAYARWAECRLPTEQEWEHAVQLLQGVPIASSHHDSLKGHWSDVLLRAGKPIHPQFSEGDVAECRLINAIGNLWEWTGSQYTAFPGYQAPEGALGEYNGKFMCNQFCVARWFLCDAFRPCPNNLS